MKLVSVGISLSMAMALLAGQAMAGELWIGHGGNFNQGGVAGQVGVYTPSATFDVVQTCARGPGVAYGDGKVFVYAAGGNGAQGTLKTIDPTTGDEIGSVLEPDNDFAFDGSSDYVPLGGLAYDRTTNTLYGVNAWGLIGGSWEYAIFTFNPADASRTLVGSAATTFDPHGGFQLSIAFDDAGRLFAMDMGGNYIAQLDKTDASFIAGTTLSIPTSDSRDYSGIGLGSDSSTGLLVGSYYSYDVNAVPGGVIFSG